MAVFTIKRAAEYLDRARKPINFGVSTFVRRASRKPSQSGKRFSTVSETKENDFMRWFWRAAIVVAVGWLYGFLLVIAPALYMNPNRLQSAIENALGSRGRILWTWQLGVGLSAAYYLPGILLAAVVYGLLTSTTLRRPETDTRHTSERPAKHRRNLLRVRGSGQEPYGRVRHPGVLDISAC